MQHNFDDYKIHIVESNNYNGKWVCYIEELYNVSEIIDNKKQAIESLRALFEKEIVRLKTFNLEIPKPNSGKAVITFAPNEKVNSLRPFIDIFWKDVLCTSYNTSFVSDESTFYPWEQYLEGGKDELIDKVRKISQLSETFLPE